VGGEISGPGTYFRCAAELLADLPDLDGTGYDPGDLDTLAKDMLPEPGDADAEEGPVVFGVIVECRGELQQAQLLEHYWSAWPGKDGRCGP
jgi:hypothetical protein